VPCVAVLVNLPKQVENQARGSALPCGYRNERSRLRPDGTAARRLRCLPLLPSGKQPFPPCARFRLTTPRPRALPAPIRSASVAARLRAAAPSPLPRSQASLAAASLVSASLSRNLFDLRLRVFRPLWSPRSRDPKIPRSTGGLRSGHCRFRHRPLYIISCARTFRVPVPAPLRAQELFRGRFAASVVTAESVFPQLRYKNLPSGKPLYQHQPHRTGFHSRTCGPCNSQNFFLWLRPPLSTVSGYR
jgi:hypothetical protein